MRARPAPPAATAVFAALLLSGCGNDGFLGQDLGEGLDLRDPTTGVVDAHGDVIDSVDVGDPVTVQVPRLSANTTYVIRISDASGTEYNPPAGMIATTDERGTIYQSTVVQNLDSGANGAAVVAPPGDYRIDIRRSSGSLVKSMEFTVRNASRVFCSDGTGNKRASFQPTEDVFVTVQRAGGSLNDGNYDIHVRSDLSPALRDDALLPSASANITVSGGTGTANLGMFAAGAFDVVIDLDDDGRYDQDEDLISRHRRLHACFTVQSANTGAAIVTQLAADRNGNHRHVFDPPADQAVPVSDLFVAGVADEASAIQETLGVAKYVVAHRDTWSSGDPLADVTEAVEIDPVQGFTLSEAPWLVWPRERLVPGCYDVVIDVDGNGVFNAGIDLVDNIDEADAATCGVRIADPLCTGNVQITNQETVFRTESPEIDITGTVTGGALGGSVTVVSGVNSALQALPAGDTFDVTTTLSVGVNYITFGFYYASGRTCALTMIVTRE